MGGSNIALYGKRHTPLDLRHLILPIGVANTFGAGGKTRT